VLVFIYCTDRPGAEEVAAGTLMEHLEYMVASKDNLVYGGMLLASPGEGSTGRLFVLELPTMQAAEDFVASEPYHRAGLFDRVEIRAFRQLWPEPEPGTLEHLLELARERRRDTQRANSAAATGSETAETREA
jgi:uncharacterized protein